MAEPKNPSAFQLDRTNTIITIVDDDDDYIEIQQGHELSPITLQFPDYESQEITSPYKKNTTLLAAMQTREVANHMTQRNHTILRKIRTRNHSLGFGQVDKLMQEHNSGTDLNDSINADLCCVLKKKQTGHVKQKEHSFFQ